MLWVLGLLLSFAGLFVWLEFGCMFPRSGGEKVREHEIASSRMSKEYRAMLTGFQVYLEAVYRYPKYLATIVFSTQAVLLGFTASGCIVFASNIWVAAGLTASAWQERGVAIGVIVVVTLTHTFAPKAGVWAMNVLSSIKIVILLFIVVVSSLTSFLSSTLSDSMLTIP